MSEGVPMQNLSASSRQDYDADTAIDLWAIFRVLWRGKFIIALSVAVAMLLALVFLAGRNPIFTASVSLLVERGSQTEIAQRDVSERPLNEAAISTQMNVITSNRVLGRVVDDFSLDQDPRFVAALQPDADGFSLSDVRLAVGRALLPVIGEIPYFSPRQNQLSDEERAQLHRRIAIASLRQRMTVSQVGSSFVIRIDVTTGSPALSAQLANAVAETYIDLQRIARLDATTFAARWLTGQIAELELQVRESTDALDAHRIEFGPSDEDRIAAATEQLERLRTSLSDVRAELAAARNSDTTAGAPTALVAREAALAQSVTESGAEVAELVQRLAKASELERRALADRRLYERFLDEANVVDALESYERADARIISDALQPLRPSNPSAKLVMALAVVLGGGFGVTVLALSELLTTTFRFRDELAAATGLPVLGVLPRHRSSNPNRLLKALESDPYSDFSDSVRTLRAAVLQGRQGQGEVVLISSAGAREGKSTTAMLLAAASADIGKDVILLDLDLRRSRLGKSLGVKHTGTTHAVLAGSINPDDAIVHVEHERFDALVARRSGKRGKASPLDLLSATWLEDLLVDLRESYDVVIVDTPPILPCTDAAIISRHVDTVLLTVRWHKTERASVTDALKILDTFGARVNGVVLNAVDYRAEAQHRAIPHRAYRQS